MSPTAHVETVMNLRKLEHLFPYPVLSPRLSSGANSWCKSEKFHVGHSDLLQGLGYGTGTLCRPLPGLLYDMFAKASAKRHRIGP